MRTRHPHDRSNPMARRGFTLLEVMCAFAILAIVTTFMTQIWAESINKASTAIDKRELREIADSVFAKILYEETEHSDGDSDTFDSAYGRWAELPQARRDRYAIYRYVLEKKLTSISSSGTTDDDEQMFENDDDTNSSSSSSSSTEAEDEAAADSAKLWRYALRVYLTEEPSEKALITLQTYRKPSEASLAENR